MKKKKIFLGAYVNQINAQNINCKSISLHLNKEKYQVKSLVLGSKNIPKLLGVSYFKVNSFCYSFSNLFAFIRAVFWADVCYLPKHQSTPRIVLKIASFFHKKIFTTIEGNMCDTSKKNMISSFGSINNMIQHFSLIPNRFGITKGIIENAKCGVVLNSVPLYLGVEKIKFNYNKSRKKLRNVVFIGSFVKTKDIDEFIQLSSYFPEISFNLVGDGPESKRLKYISGDNVIFHNKLNHECLSKLLRDMDLHFLPSKSEGFPKVILETASSAIPSIVYKDYGANEWITHRENGFIVSNFNEVIDVLHELIKRPDFLERNSQNVLELADKFDWKIVIKDWEKVIDNII